MEKDYSHNLSEELRLKVRKSLPYVLFNIIKVNLNNERRELILPKNPLEQAVYFLVSEEHEHRLEHSLLYRITDFGQSITSLLSHPEYENISKALREIYNNLRIRKKMANLSLPSTILQKKFWVNIVKPEDDNNLAQNIERVLEEYQVIEFLETKGREVLEKRLY